MTSRRLRPWSAARRAHHVGELARAGWAAQPTSAPPVRITLATERDSRGVAIQLSLPTTWQDLAATQVIADRYPNVPLVIGAHGGFSWLQVVEMITDAPNTYLDTSGTFSVLQLTVAAAEIPDRLIFGSNSPYGEPWLARQIIERTIPSAEVRAAILGETAATLLGGIP